MPVLPEDEEEFNIKMYSDIDDDELETHYFDDDLIQLLNIDKERFDEDNKRVLQ